MKKLLLLLTAVAALYGKAIANNIQVSNVGLGGQNAATHFSLVNYNISWNNGWRTSTNENNYDGAWIFVKYRKANTSEWRHATINATGNTEPSGSVIKVSSDGKGAWMYRSANGQGSVSWAGAKLRWNYGVDGVNDNDSVEIRVFAVEMVYIPSGAFYLGSGGTGNNEFRKGGAGTAAPFLVSSAGPVYVANNDTSLYYANIGLAGDQAGPVPVTYPNGYNGFWLMKYEASQQQVVDFLNHLDIAKYTANNPGGFTGTHPSLVAPQPERACGISWKIMVAYADWSGMRPYTEMEYEKACRGANINPVANECAWGNTTFIGLTGVSNMGADSEVVNLPANANCNYLNSYGAAVRCGLFATATSDRVTAGAGYYGNLEMSGNLSEYVITSGSADGRAFTGAHGDGMIDGAGNANVPGWPGVSGAGTRGSSAATTFYPNMLQVSDRSNGTSATPATTVGLLAIRLARTAE